MKCPVCQEKITAKPLGEGVEYNCSHCRIYRSYVGKTISARSFLYCYKYKDSDLLVESLKLYRHSEWPLWSFVADGIEDSKAVSDTQFGAFADWLADNGFPLQEEAVRQLLEK